MKRIIIFIAITFLLVSLWGCSGGSEVCRNEQFSVKETNGEFYLEFHSDSYRVAAGSIDQQGALSGHRICFSSVKEMKECIEQGRFSETDLIGMQNYAKASNGKVAVCNLNKLYDVKLPSDTKLKEISWKGTTYTFIAEKDSVTVKIQLTTKENRDEYIAGWDIDGNDNLKIISQEVNPADGTTTVEFENLAFGYRGKQVRYTATVEGGTITYFEMYDYSESESLPCSISFWGESNGAYFYAGVSGYEENISREWLTSIAVVPYVETATE